MVAGEGVNIWGELPGRENVLPHTRLKQETYVHCVPGAVHKMCRHYYDHGAV